MTNFVIMIGVELEDREAFTALARTAMERLNGIAGVRAVTAHADGDADYLLSERDHLLNAREPE